MSSTPQKTSTARPANVAWAPGHNALEWVGQRVPGFVLAAILATAANWLAEWIGTSVLGFPPIVSERGGLAESAGGAGFVVPLPASLTLATSTPVAADDVRPWIECMERLANHDIYAAESARARAASAIYQPAALAPRYLDFFTRVLNNAKPRG